MSTKIIVVGGGLSGLSQQHTCLERGQNVLLVDKNPFCGGNSTKQTSGINGQGTVTQRKKGVKDSPEIFLEDTMRGGQKSVPHQKVLTYESGPGVDWLMSEPFNLDLSLISRMGGHSVQRCHRGKQKFPGMTITYRLMECLEDVQEKDEKRQKILLKTELIKLLKDSNGTCIGQVLKDLKSGKTWEEHGPVILQTGGYGQDQSEGSLLIQHRPDLKGMPTTCGDHCTGDGIKLSMRDMGQGQVDLNSVQVHPTGLVNPKKPNEKTLFLQQEQLRGCGGLLIDCEGNRFQNELGRRDYVSNRMYEQNKFPYRLCLNSKQSKEIEWHCKHYKGRGLMNFYNNMKELCDEQKIPLDNLKKTFQHHNEIDKKQQEQPDQGPYDQYTGGKTWDSFGKKFFLNGPMSVDDCFHVQIVTPVVHYTMGGMKVTPQQQAQKEDGQIIKGLFGQGEVNGGIHGENRLGGSSLLDCVVYGRVQGRTQTKHLMESNIDFVGQKL